DFVAGAALLFIFVPIVIGCWIERKADRAGEFAPLQARGKKILAWDAVESDRLFCLLRDRTSARMVAALGHGELLEKGAWLRGAGTAIRAVRRCSGNGARGVTRGPLPLWRCAPRGGGRSGRQLSLG